jgi:hypothetical protein
MAIIEVRNVTKVFGPHPDSIIPLLAEKWSIPSE